MQNREIEAKFLEIDKPALIQKLRGFGATDKGERLIKDVIFSDGAGEWIKDGRKTIRLRQDRGQTFFTYKHVQDQTAAGTEEIEFAISDLDKAKDLLLALGFVLARDQEKRRHTFRLGEVTADIDTWPKVPTYLELEGPSEQAIKDAAQKLGFEWAKAVFGTAAMTIEKYYGIGVRTLKYFTFKRVE